MHTSFGIRTSVDMQYAIDPYGNICNFKDGNFEPYFGPLPPDIKWSSRQEKMGWKNWPYLKGVPREQIIPIAGMYYQDWMFGHIYEMGEGGTLVHNPKLSPTNTKSFLLGECNVIPLHKEAIEPRELTSLPMSLAEALDGLEKNEWCYKVSPSGNRMYAKGSYILIYNGLKVMKCPTREIRKSGWEVVTSVPSTVILKLEELAEKDKDKKTQEFKEEIIKPAQLNLEGEAPTDKLLEAVSNLAQLAGKLIDSGELEAGTKLAEKLTYTIGHVSWKMRDK